MLVPHLVYQLTHGSTLWHRGTSRSHKGGDILGFDALLQHYSSAKPLKLQEVGGQQHVTRYLGNLAINEGVT